MSKKALVASVQPDPNGPVFGQVSDPGDFMKAQIFAHNHVEQIARDFIIGSCSGIAVAGFAYSLTGGLGFRLYAPGQIIDAQGLSYEIDAAFADLPPSQADPTNPRIDLIVATPQADVASAAQLRPFTRLRTQAELSATPQVPPYPPTQFTEPTEQHTLAALSIVPGTAANPPAAPALQPGQVPLYAITINAGATVLTKDDITDLRAHVGSLCELQGRIDLLAKQIAAQVAPHRHPAAQIDIGLGGGIWAGKTVEDYIDAQVNAQTGRDPVTMPLLWPKGATGVNGKVLAVANLDGAIPVVDFDPTQTMVFGDGSVRPFSTAMFNAALTAALNPRVVNTDIHAGTQAEDNPVSPLTMAMVNSVVSDGGGDFVQKNGVAPAARLGAAAAAVDGRYVAVYGGLGGLGGGLLSDFFLYDSIQDQCTTLALTGTIPPAADRPALFSCGDGIHVLLGTAGSNGQTPRWFLINAQTGATVEKFNGPVNLAGGSIWWWIGDLIQPNIIAIVALGSNNNATPSAQSTWVYHVDTGLFELLATVGNMPLAPLGAVDACIYQQGQLIVQYFDILQGASGQSFIFNYPTLTWSPLNIPQPYNPFTLNQGPISAFRMANFGGKVFLVGGTDYNSTQQAYWQLTPGPAAAWQQFNTSLPRRWEMGMASLLVNGLPIGAGYVITGRAPLFTPPWTADIWAFAPGGVIQTIFNGQSALTLAPGTKQATFRLADYQFQHIATAATVYLTLTGSLPPGTVKISESFDGGASFQPISPATITTILSSTVNKRLLQVTLISSGSNIPILAGVFEHFEVPAGPGFSGLVLRVNVPAGTTAWYVNRDGSISQAATPVVASTPDKSLLLKTTFNGAGVNPTVFAYRNKRRVHLKFTGVRAAGVIPPIANDLSSTPTYVNAYGISGATGALYKITDPTFVLDTNVAVVGLTADGDSYLVEVVCGDYYPGF